MKYKGRKKSNNIIDLRKKKNTGRNPWTSTTILEYGETKVGGPYKLKYNRSAR